MSSHEPVLSDTLLHLKRFATIQDTIWVQQRVAEWRKELGVHDLLPQGAGFRDQKAWWSEGKLRQQPHEGIDILLPAGSAVPAVLEGQRISTIPKAEQPGDIKRGYDIIGSTIILAHRICDTSDRLLVTIYGHMDPSDGDNQDGVIGTIAPSTRDTLPAHLHLSTGWAEVSDLAQITSWQQIHFEEKSCVELFDPLLAAN